MECPHHPYNRQVKKKGTMSRVFMLGVCITSSPLLSKLLLGLDHNLRLLGNGPTLGTRPMLVYHHTWDVERDVGLGYFNSPSILFYVLLSLQVQLAELYAFVFQLDVEYWVLCAVIYWSSFLSWINFLPTCHLIYQLKYNIEIFYVP